MIAVKNLQNLNEILVQEELTSAKTKCYCDQIRDKDAKKILVELNEQSVKNHEEVIKYLESHLAM